MKKFAVKYSYALLIVSAVLVAAVLSLSVLLYFSVKEQRAVLESEKILYGSELYGTAEKLAEALERENTVLSYHYAASLAELSALAGEGENAALFRKMSETLLSGNTAENALIKQAVDEFLATGELRGAENSDAVSEQYAEEYRVSAYAIETASECVKKLFGEHNTLRLGRRCGSGELIYSCSNAYAVIDERSGQPMELAVSFPPAEKRLSEDECAGHAMRFLEKFHPAEAADAQVKSITADEAAGAFDITIKSRGREISLTVRRDTGSVVRLRMGE